MDVVSDKNMRRSPLCGSDSKQHGHTLARCRSRSLGLLRSQPQFELRSQNLLELRSQIQFELRSQIQFELRGQNQFEYLQQVFSWRLSPLCGLTTGYEI